MNQKKKRKRISPAEKKDALKEACKFFLDLAKLVFAGVILAGIMDMEIEKSRLVIAGCNISLLLTTVGALFYYRAIKKRLELWNYCTYIMV